jgi:ribosome-binding protein aMBF1 (putative translation factor)
MKPAKRKRLEAAGWQVGTATDFLELRPDEVAYIELKLDLSRTLREWRTDQGLTQMELARQLRSSQSRVAKMEAGDATVSVDLLLRSLFHLGASAKDIAKAIS